MRINEVMKETGLTKKAIYYYEDEGLIKPQKDPDNNYRNYSEEDVRKLVVINILRRLDVPIKAIGDIISNLVPMKDVLKKQLIMTNQKINTLHQNKIMLNNLITKEITEKDFSFDTLKEFNFELDRVLAASGQAGKKLERIFPGTLGKTISVFYSHFLNVSLDTDEKIAAWNELVRKLDEMKEIEFPEDIKKIVDELYGEVDDDKIVQWEKISRPVIDEMIKRQSKPDEKSILIAKESPEGYCADLEKKNEPASYDKLHTFMVGNLDLFMEVDRYIALINEDYNKLRNQLREEGIETYCYNNEDSK